MLRRVNAIAFVDWRSQISNAHQVDEQRPIRKAERTISYVSRELAKCLQRYIDVDFFSLQIRLYHGWHMGLTPSDNKRALDDLFSEGEYPKVVGNVHFDWSQPYGNSLLAALSHRRHPRLRIHLPDTLREDIATGNRLREKMVDSALVCDLLCTARSAPTDWKVVMGEDDDLVPGAFVSERWSKEVGGKTILLRSRADPGFLQLAGILTPIGADNA